MANEPGKTNGARPAGNGQPAGADKPAREPTFGADAPASPAAPRPPQTAAAKSGEPAPRPPATSAPQRLVDAPPGKAGGRPAAPRPAPGPLLSARAADRLAAMNPPPPRRTGGGCLTFLLVIVILAGGGYFLWRAGQLDRLIVWAQPYTEKVRPYIAKIETLIPGHQEAPVEQSDEAMILETKQLLLKLDFQPGPMNGTLDPATVAAIEAYQETAGLPVDGQPSPALLDELRGVANPGPK